MTPGRDEAGLGVKRRKCAGKPRLDIPKLGMHLNVENHDALVCRCRAHRRPKASHGGRPNPVPHAISIATAARSPRIPPSLGFGTTLLGARGGRGGGESRRAEGAKGLRLVPSGWTRRLLSLPFSIHTRAGRVAELAEPVLGLVTDGGITLVSPEGREDTGPGGRPPSAHEGGHVLRKSLGEVVSNRLETHLSAGPARRTVSFVPSRSGGRLPPAAEGVGWEGTWLGAAQPWTQSFLTANRSNACLRSISPWSFSNWLVGLCPQQGGGWWW